MSKQLKLPFFTLALLTSVSAVCQQPSDTLSGVRALLTAGKFAESEAALNDYLRYAPNSAEAHFLLGYVYFREQKASESLAEFTTGAKFKRPSASDLKIVASDYALLKAYPDADKWFTEVVSETPNDADAWYLLGRAKYNESDIAAAAQMFEHALALRPKYIEAENNLGLCWRELNKLADAQTAFRTAIDWEGDPPSDAQPFLNLGSLLTEQGDFEKAVPYLEEAGSLSPGNPKIHEALGDAYVARQNLPKAQSEFEHAIDLAPEASALHYKLGQIFRKEGQRDLAQKQFDICAKLNGAQSSTKTPNPYSPDHPTPQ
jgi:tetratricopeptide (TPR) repeat protein